MQRILLSCLLLWACGLVACQRPERTLVDLLRFPDEVRTVVIAPEYESWYHDVGEDRDDGATADGATADGAAADGESLDQKYDEEGDEDRDVEESGEALDDECKVDDDTFEEDSLETHIPRE